MLNNLYPYLNKPKEEWLNITNKLIESHPLTEQEIVDTCLSAWEDMFNTEIGSARLKIGSDIFPTPQIIGYLLHELIPAEIEKKHPLLWRKDESAHEKDLVCLENDYFSTEVKTSSNKSQIFGNRSYAQESINDKKSKNGFYITINFTTPKKDVEEPKVNIIRFGWLDHTDWIAQKAASGQQARLSPDAYLYKLKVLYKN